MTDQAKRLHAVVHGKVQAVSFRYFTLRAAQPLGITGWVRNRFNGTVEIIMEGEEHNLEKLLEIVRHGPPSSNVSMVDHNWESVTGDFKKFKIRMTG
ncbi:MAG: acylphosphatase [Chloroflexi bacterium]|nr:acylphosphatase [Chloroflexota bacterium]